MPSRASSQNDMCLRLLDALENVGIENPIICANINKIGSRMCGGVREL